ncbi:phosphomannose isomerase type II C-terminal cupin domain [Weeksella virosa]|uniref:Mannose-6-phosphate isomerase type II n=1 Tax=Weeksella virosa (strain ATCC 43766 / DSM 16922 / JCM 21250 / CCUG 30538 / CDC 9751 / IAM 14551 / NBRC 16016 / NCTC 11634 / CL345/78) TaxID=865938 RepID=F0P1W5_WEEVC|nr:phosphomannose isomerase type II C-terminal cupin domain [Weeksella virosa]ADX67675.1 mannose-6-phosphate isomerase type II [Weeksella virosa DSM 16922]MDK7373966.1 phosphomannose isomerase type II C-terminal cupin domain [Weeksella virosa]MDK7674221.1 phosphomannose isomerase type II C-terminal cupin domain [Weeksella virosa]SUP53973.1 Alginate biosynthesis protein AlgA [Weeksella virosa]VEH64700.1 Alginate biosynthesis protein AlgA [Weeksella virosa]
MEIGQRPWGSYYVLEATETHKVKRIEVNVGARLSYQYHRYRAEVWTIIQGEAKVTLDDVETLYHPGQVVEIPLNAKHRIENIGKIPLIFIEVQFGESFDEDDIVRIEDDYSRI